MYKERRGEVLWKDGAFDNFNTDGGKRICKEVQQGAGDVGGEPGKRGAGEAFREEERLIALNAAEG